MMNASVIDKASRTIPINTLESVQKPIAEATGMPNAVYRNPDLFKFERDNILCKTWSAIAFTSELPQKGYAKPIDFMGLPLLVL
jgi:choline monooxygenase